MALFLLHVLPHYHSDEFGFFFLNLNFLKSIRHLLFLIWALRFFCPLVCYEEVGGPNHELGISRALGNSGLSSFFITGWNWLKDLHFTRTGVQLLMMCSSSLCTGNTSLAGWKVLPDIKKHRKYHVTPPHLSLLSREWDLIYLLPRYFFHETLQCLWSSPAVQIDCRTQFLHRAPSGHQGQWTTTAMEFTQQGSAQTKPAPGKQGRRYLERIETMKINPQPYPGVLFPLLELLWWPSRN